MWRFASFLVFYGVCATPAASVDGAPSRSEKNKGTCMLQHTTNVTKTTPSKMMKMAAKGKVELFFKTSDRQNAGTDDIPLVKFDDEEEWRQLPNLEGDDYKENEWDMHTLEYPKDPCAVSIKAGGKDGWMIADMRVNGREVKEVAELPRWLDENCGERQRPCSGVFTFQLRCGECPWEKGGKALVEATPSQKIKGMKAMSKKKPPSPGMPPSSGMSTGWANLLATKRKTERKVELFFKTGGVRSAMTSDIPLVRFDDEEEWHQLEDDLAKDEYKKNKWDMHKIEYPKDPCAVSIKAGGKDGWMIADMRVNGRKVKKVAELPRWVDENCPGSLRPCSGVFTFQLRCGECPWKRGQGSRRVAAIGR